MRARHQLTSGSIKNTSGNIQQAEARQLKKMSKGKQSSFDPTKNKKLTVYVAETFPAWQNKYRDILQEHWETAGNADAKSIMGKVDKQDMKKAMPFLQVLKKRLDSGESPQRVFERGLSFKEVDVLREMVPGLQSTVRKLDLVEVVRLREDGKGEVVFALGKDQAVSKFGSKEGDVVAGVTSDVTPGNPASVFANIDAE